MISLKGMKLAFSGVLVLACVLAACACSSDSKDSGTPVAAAGSGGDGAEISNGGAGGVGDATNPGDACHSGCVATLAAACSNGPTDQASCESSCHELETGKCGGEYATFQSCAEGKAITCGAQGMPVVAACSDEQAAFIACLNN
jgi:hypothetical protein